MNRSENTDNGQEGTALHRRITTGIQDQQRIKIWNDITFKIIHYA